MEIYSYFDDSNMKVKYGREIFAKNLPPNINECWLLEYFARFGRLVEIRHNKNTNQAHVKYMSFEEACNAVGSFLEHSVQTGSGLFNLKIVHSRDFPFLCFYNFTQDYDFSNVDTVFRNHFGPGIVNGVEVNEEQRKVIVEFNCYRFCKSFVTKINHSRNREFVIDNQHLYVHWNKIPALTVLGLEMHDSNEMLMEFFSPGVKKVVRKTNLAYVWFTDITYPSNIMEQYDSYCRLPSETVVKLEWLGQ